MKKYYGYYTIPIILIAPVFIALSLYSAKIAGDSEIGRLSGELADNRRIAVELRSENTMLTNRVRELMVFKNEAVEKTRRVEELEKELQLLKGMSPANPVPK